MAERNVMTRRRGTRALTVLAGAFMLASIGAASAQDKPAETTATDRPNWLKVCSTEPNTKKEFCIVAQELRAQTGQFLSSVAVREVKGDQKKVLAVFVPTGMLLQPGLRLQVDQGKQLEGKYLICFPDRCYSEIPIDEAFIGSLKKGNELTVTALNQQGRAVSFKMTLLGFTKAYDGPAVDPQVLAQQQQQLQDELQKRAEEARKKLLEGTSDEAPAAQPEAPATQQ